MRTRDEILKASYGNSGFVPTERFQLALLVEVLVDIRDLLATNPSEK